MFFFNDNYFFVRYFKFELIIYENKSYASFLQ